MNNANLARRELVPQGLGQLLLDHVCFQLYPLSSSGCIPGTDRAANVSSEAEADAGGDLAEEGQLIDAAVLDLELTEAVEAVLADFTAKHATWGHITQVMIGHQGRSQRCC